MKLSASKLRGSSTDYTDYAEFFLRTVEAVLVLKTICVIGVTCG